MIRYLLACFLNSVSVAWFPSNRVFAGLERAWAAARASSSELGRSDRPASVYPRVAATVFNPLLSYGMPPIASRFTTARFGRLPVRKRKKLVADGEYVMT